MDQIEARRVLDIHNPGVSRQGIKDAYRAKLKELRPDLNTDYATRHAFSLVQEAHKVLKDQLTRRAIKRFRPAVPTIKIPMSTAFIGGTVICEIPKMEMCGHCDGNGRVGPDCAVCLGIGVIGSGLVKPRCNYCDGTGQAFKCERCDGLGVKEVGTVEVDVVIPAMTTSGTLIPSSIDYIVNVVYTDVDKHAIINDKLIYWHTVTLTQVIQGYSIHLLGVKEVVIPPMHFSDIEADNYAITINIEADNFDVYHKLANILAEEGKVS